MKYLFGYIYKLYAHVNNCKVDKASLSAFVSALSFSYFMVLSLGVFCLHHHFTGVLGTPLWHSMWHSMCYKLCIFPKTLCRGHELLANTGLGAGCYSVQQHRDLGVLSRRGWGKDDRETRQCIKETKRVRFK